MGVRVKAHDIRVILGGEPRWCTAVPCNATLPHDWFQYYRCTSRVCKDDFLMLATVLLSTCFLNFANKIRYYIDLSRNVIVTSAFSVKQYHRRGYTVTPATSILSIYRQCNPTSSAGCSRVGACSFVAYVLYFLSATESRCAVFRFSID